MQRKTILVVDDNKNNLDLMLVTLNQDNYRLIAATSGEKAIELSKKVTPDLILMDILMPGMDGFETTRKLKKEPDLKHVPVLFLSALSDLKNVVECFRAGGVDYISKPFRKEELLARVKTHLSIKDMQDKISTDRDTFANLLKQILPQNIIEELRRGKKPEPDQVDDAVILFTDFSGFTSMSKKLGSQNTIEHLSTLFSAFDEIVTHFGLERLKIIGDSYMAIGNVNNNISNPSLHGVMAGLKIQDFLNFYNNELPENYWKARIGIHVGTVMAGIIGMHRIAFDVWGDAVNLASRLETQALTEGVNITNPVSSDIDKYIEKYSRGVKNLHNVGDVELIQCSGIKSVDGEATELYYSLNMEETLTRSKKRPNLMETISEISQY